MSGHEAPKMQSINVLMAAKEFKGLYGYQMGESRGGNAQMVYEIIISEIRKIQQASVFTGIRSINHEGWGSRVQSLQASCS